MKKTASKIIASFLTASIAMLNIPVSFAEDNTEMPEMITVVESEPSEYGLTTVKYIDEDGNEVTPDLMPEREDCAVNLPASYDLRNYGYVTSVKNQKDTGTCWAHAALASAESNMIMKGIATKSIDLSEAHLVWFGHCCYSTDPADLLYQEGENYGTAGYDRGASYRTANNALARWNGLQLESSFVNVTERPQLSETYRYTSFGYLQNSDYLDKNDSTGIKQHLMNTGALMISYYYDDEYCTKNKVTTYCPDEDMGTNHAVTLVGWDDNYSKYNFKTTPPSNGAWLCKNSWGTESGDNGYFYISYYDKSIDRITSIEIADQNKYDNIYQYDGMNSSSIGYNNINLGIAGANIFTADKNEKVSAVSFYTYDASVPYTIEVYTNVKKGSPTSGKCAYTQDGTATYAGYHVIDLQKAVSVAKGTNFSVVVILKKAGTRLWIDEKSSAENCSFLTYYENNSIGKWEDVRKSYDSDVCIKALTVTTDKYVPDCIETGNHTYGDWTGNNPDTHIRTCIECGAADTASHSYGSAVKNGDNHSRTCSVCKYVDTHTALEWSDYSATYHRGSCPDCSYSEYDAHIYSEWDKNSSGHSATCTLCGRINSKAHTYGSWTKKDGEHSRSCTECGYTQTGSHNFGDWTSKNGTHSHSCTDCGYTETLEHSFSAWTEKDGVHTRYCTDCGYTETGNHSFVDVDTENNSHTRCCSECGYMEAGNHSFGKWISDSTTHSRICSECDYTETGNHSFSEWTSKNGTHTRYCTECGYTQTGNHAYSEWTSENGTHSRYCTDCGYTQTGNHNLSAWTEKDDIHSRTCSDCGYTETENHSFGELTADEDGTHSHSCTECGYTETLEHSFGKWKSGKDGTHSRTCSDCGYIETESHELTLSDSTSSTHYLNCDKCGYRFSGSHNFDNWTHNDNTHSGICSDCGYIETGDHEYTSSSKTSTAHYLTCGKCGYVLSGSHTFSEWTIDETSHSHTCEDCNYTVLKKHSYSSWTESGDGHEKICRDCDYSVTESHNMKKEICADGIVKYTCKDCDAVKTETIKYIKGDINGDGRTDVFDMALIRKIYKSGLAEDTDIYAADMNEDLKFSIADLVSLNNFILGK